MAGRPILQLVLSEAERTELERQADSQNRRQAKRAKIVLYRARGLSQDQTAKKLGCSPDCVGRWTQRFRQAGLNGLVDIPGRGRKPKTSPTSPSTKPKRHPKKPPRPASTKKPDASNPKKKPEPDHAHTLPDSPSIREVAEVARVSMMTVSRALSNHPHVHPRLKQQVLAAARKTGYKPDPELRKLMIHLRKRKALRLQGSICSFEAKAWDKASDSYFSALKQSAKARAESLGFAWETFPLEDFISNPERCSRILYYRGVEGILITPTPLRMNLSKLPDNAHWERFSVVTATSSILSPAFRKVMPDYFRNMMSICSKLEEDGYQRFGLVLARALDKRVQHLYTGAFAAFHLSTQRSMIPPVLFSHPNGFDTLPEWYHREKPDALIVGSSCIAKEITEELNIPLNGHVPIAAVTLMDDSTAGINERPEDIGAMAAETLGTMIVHHEKGAITKPAVTLVEGEWKNCKAPVGQLSNQRCSTPDHSVGGI